MFNWRSRTRNPNDLAALAEMDRFLDGVSQFPQTTREKLIEDFVDGARVLDIGAGGHDPSGHTLETWEHHRISVRAEAAVAVDIDAETAAHYRDLGYDFRVADATSDVDLGERFTRAFLGDVIEHVDAPRALLEFTARHLSPNGRLMVTTPNPFHPRWAGARRRHRRRFYETNLEHVSWVTPSNMVELAHRAGFVLTAMYWPLLKKQQSPAVDARAAWRKRFAMKASPIESLWKEYIYELTLK